MSELDKESNKRVNEEISEVTRFEVISKNGGRDVVEYGVKVELSIQDDGRTLKIFLEDRK
jgi:hypothetical protein